jgi:hypothetical protein
MKILNRDDTEHGVEYVTRADAEREIEAWKTNHDNQVEIKRIIADRPDLDEHARKLECQRAELAEALREMRYGHTDKAERMAVAALAYLENADGLGRRTQDSDSP